MISLDKVFGIMMDDWVKVGILIGSEFVGVSLAVIVGRVIKKMVLEFGGSDFFIVLESVDLEIVVIIVVIVRMLNNG